MWITNDLIVAVDKVATIFYIDWQQAQQWNANRDTGQPRLMTGWVWSSKPPGKLEQAGFKNQTTAYIDAWYHLVQGYAPPKIVLPVTRLRRVK